MKTIRFKDRFVEESGKNICGTSDDKYKGKFRFLSVRLLGKIRDNWAI